MGAFGEASSDLDRVITALAESRVLYLSRESPCGGLTVTSNPPVPALVGGGQECVKEDCGEQPGVTILLITQDMKNTDALMAQQVFAA